MLATELHLAQMLRILLYTVMPPPLLCLHDMDKDNFNFFICTVALGMTSELCLATNTWECRTARSQCTLCVLGVFAVAVTSVW
jgi:hypothetical protein